MSDTLRYQHFKQLFLGEVELNIGDRIEIQFDGQWHAGTVEWSREWSAFYIRIANKTLWMWEGACLPPARLASPKPGTPPAK